MHTTWPMAAAKEPPPTLETTMSYLQKYLSERPK